ncbi:uncharacterized protein LOC107013293 [Solanum pennellii]|uniref:Uncharacterized protein LOC107013293 n=1 Tax=Solanum pennellii TaxID=28526 RepID=A0ABM1GBL1_SOLPN|nr:uncharacterized protein LOC107013293 [Solanum pennellii]
MGHLTQSGDVCASRIEVVVLGMIEWASVAVLDHIMVKMRENREMIDGHRLALDDLVVRIETCEQDVPTSSEISLASMPKDFIREDAVVESEVETDDSEISIRDATVYDDLEDLEGDMVQTPMQDSSRETSMKGSSGAKDAD